MKLQQGAELVQIELILVDRENRQRRQFKTDDLESSIKRRGLMSPIIIDREMKLHAGERRLTACRNLGHKTILVRFVEDLSSLEAQIIELEENLKRVDLEWQEIVRATGKIHRLYLETDSEWTMGDTAEELGLTISTVSLYLSVEEEIDEPKVVEAGTVREAFNRLKRRDQRMAGVALQELLDGPDIVPSEIEPTISAEDLKRAEALKAIGEPIPAELKLKLAQPQGGKVVQLKKPEPESILHCSFLDWAPKYKGPKFNLLHCDFPYGVEMFAGPQGRGAEGAAGYNDSADVYTALLQCLCQNLDKIMSVAGHLMFWYTADHKLVSQTIRYFNEHVPTLNFHKFPLIWGKSDQSGIASDPRRGPRHAYELCLLASRGDRNIAKVKADFYSAPPDRKLHPSTKPEPMLRHFMEMLVDETTSLLDPTCGSGASLRAAESLGAKRVLGLEIDQQYIVPARTALKQSRAKLAASKMERVL